MGDARKGSFNLESGLFKYPNQQRFDDLKNAVLLRKTHLQIDLSEFRLTVSAQVFVAEAAHNLEILFIASNHQKLFENLRRLRQGVKLTRVDAARHQKIASPFGSGLGHKGRFNFQKAHLVQFLPSGKGHLRTQNNVALHAGPTQIHVTVFQTRVFVNVVGIIHGERRSAALIEDPHFVHKQFYFTSVQSRVNGIGSAQQNFAFHGHHKFRAQHFRLGVDCGINVRFKNNLGDAEAIPQVNEDDSAQIAAAVHPSHHQRAFPRVGCPQLAAIMSAAKVSKKIEWYLFSHIRY